MRGMFGFCTVEAEELLIDLTHVLSKAERKAGRKELACVITKL